MKSKEKSIREIGFVLAFMAPIVSMPADAVDIELGFGQTRYVEQPNGIWYQEGFPYQLELTTVSNSIGISAERNGIRYRLEYLDLGPVSSNAVATSDVKYTQHYVQTCGDNCDLLKFAGIGEVAGIVLSASRPVRVFDLPLYVEAGVFFYEPKWNVQVYTLDEAPELVADVRHEPKMEVGPVIGFGVRYSGVDIGVRYIYCPATTDEWPGVYKGAYTLMLKAYF